MADQGVHALHLLKEAVRELAVRLLQGLHLLREHHEGEGARLLEGSLVLVQLLHALLRVF